MTECGMANQAERIRIRSILVAAFTTGLVSFAVLYSPQPLLHLVAADYRVTPAASALTISLPSLMLAVSSIAMLWLGRRFPAAKVLPLAVLASGVVNMGVWMSPWWAGVVAGRTVFGLLAGVIPAAVVGYLAAEIPAERMGRAMSWYIAGTGAGGLLGRLIAGLLTEPFGYRASLLGIGAVALAFGLILLVAFPKPVVGDAARPPGRLDLAGLGQALCNPRAASIYLLGFFAMSSFVAIFNYLPFELSSPRFGLSQSSLTLSFLPLALGVFMVPIFGMFYDRLGPRVMTSLAFFLLLTGSLVTLTRSIPVLFLGIMLIALGAFAGHSSATATLGRQREVDPAYAASLYMFCYYMGSAISGYLAGMAYDSGGWSAIITATAILCGLGVGVALAVLPRNPH
ncbi:MFS transporter [Allosediminivita pacifica]|uniref:YNFM family putative membrane transporter n=2 Tax=Allosediminivita pacifica TaxID=1267769 RepID=A0A2T6A7G6_9RHOB|nr:YNFM family putative membrane transporter [Allosediminivita pacifica]GGB27100.1 MFS transporter [Allosediminivita pacifica]